MQYKYVAVNKLNEKKKGYFVADDEKELAIQLSKRGLFLVKATPYTGKTPSAFFTLGTGKVKPSELTQFCRQYAIMLNAGVSLLGGIEVLKNQTFSGYFKSILGIIYDDVKGGMMLSDAMKKHKSVFPVFFMSMIKVGEKSGKLEEVMNALAEYYEKDSELRRKVKSAFAYPLFLFFLMVAIIILMMVYIVPTFRENLSALNITPEGLTKIIYDSSDFVLANWKYMLAGVVVVVLLFWAIGKTKKGKYFYDMLKVELPFIKKLNRDRIASKFARGFGLLLSSGMDVNDALESVVILLENKYIEKRFRLASDDVRNGMPLADSFNNYNIFPPILIQMIAIGERTAALDEILTRSCSYYDGVVETSLASLTGKIQPVMLIILGSVIGVMFIGVYSPMIDIMNQLV